MSEAVASECVLLLYNVFVYYRDFVAAAGVTMSEEMIVNLSSLRRMCSLTIQCVRLLQGLCGGSRRDHVRGDDCESV